MMSRTKMSMTLVACALACASSLSHADQLADIKARGTLICGVLPNVEPMGSLDPNSRELVGYDIDFCKAVAKSIGVKPELKIISMEARIPELLEGRVDILAAILGYTAARAEQIAYSHAYFVSDQVLAAKKGNPYKVREDLSGKRISTIKGSSNIALVQKALPTARLVTYDDPPAAFMSMVQGKVDGFVLSETMLRRFVTKLGPDAGINILQPPVGKEYWGLGVRKGQRALMQVVNDALDGMEKSGEAQRIFDQWLGPNTTYKMRRDFKIEPIKG